MRISRGIKEALVEFKPIETSLLGDAQEVFIIKNAFTTLNGSWEPSIEPDNPYTIEQWARDAYLRPWDAPDVFDDAGGDHHLFFRFENADGSPRVMSGSKWAGRRAQAWTDGYDKLLDPGYSNYMLAWPKTRSGWGNYALFQHYYPGQGQQGPWCIKPFGPAETAVGIGMPNNWHVSTFVIWTTVPRDEWEGQTPGYSSLKEALAKEAQKAQVIQFNPKAALQRAIFAANFVPNSPEFDLEYNRVAYRAQRAEHLRTGEVRVYFAMVGQWDIVEWVPGIVK